MAPSLQLYGRQRKLVLPLIHSKLSKCHFSRFLATTYVCIVRLPTIGNLNRLPPPFRSSAQRQHRGEGRESAGRRAARVQLRGLRVSAGGRPYLVVRPDRRHGRHGRRARGELEVKHSGMSNIPAFLNLLRSRKNYIRAFISSTRTKSVNIDYLAITFLNSCHFPFSPPTWREEPNVLPGRELPKVCLT